jgi:casein kinase II subunit beta
MTEAIEPDVEGVGSSDFDSDIDDDNSSTSECPSWISWFVTSQGFSLLCEVDAAYIEDQFNIYGLKSYIADGNNGNNYQRALDNILDRKESWVDEPAVVEASHLLYGLSHARYIVTVQGLSKMVSE